MHIPDFRANERTFQLLVQVAGRAGRGDRAGEVIVQTFTPQAEAIQFSRQADFAGFAAAELKMRRDFNYPPYRHLIHHLFRGPNPEKLKFFAEQWAKLVEKTLGDRVELRGPVAVADREDQGRVSLAALVFHQRRDEGRARARADARGFRVAGRYHAGAGRGSGELDVTGRTRCSAPTPLWITRERCDCGVFPRDSQWSLASDRSRWKLLQPSPSCGLRSRRFVA